MLTGPVPAARAALKRAGMENGNVDLFKVNVNGGAIALRHPLGATGAMLPGIVLDELERKDKIGGLVTLCITRGMGTAAVIERI